MICGALRWYQTLRWHFLQEMKLEPSKTACWRHCGVRPEGLPEGVTWKPNGFVVLGAALNEPSEFVDAGVSVASSQAAH